MANERLIGQKAIMQYIGIFSQPTWVRYKRLGLPLQRTPGGRVLALTSELNAWLSQWKARPCYVKARENGAFASLGPR